MTITKTYFSHWIWGILFLSILFMLFAPIQIGGGVSYVVISGNSMEPDIHKGDLVIARRQKHYNVGDAVIYRHSTGAYIFHRIIDRSGYNFILQGDNNSWIDEYHPSISEIVGKLWFHIPLVGKYVEKLRSPGAMVVLVVLMFASVTKATQNEFTRKSKNRRNRKVNHEDSPPNPSISSNLEVVLIMGVIAFLAMILGLLAFLRPVQKRVADNIDYMHVGVLLYNAPDLQDLYDTDQIKTGEPVFLQTVCQLQYYFGYQLTSEQMTSAEAEHFAGIYQIKAQISDPNGWNRSLDLVSPTEFSGSGFTSATSLNICHVRDLITDMEEKTGNENGWYTLSIFPEVFIAGSIDGRLLDGKIAPKFDFQISQRLMRLPSDFEESGKDSLSHIQAGMLPGSSLALNSLNIFGLALPVVTVRVISSIVFSACLLVIIRFGWPLYREWKRGDASRIRVQYDPMLVDVRPGSVSTNGQAVPVDSFDDLAKLAERYGAMILCETKGDLNKYWVQDGDVMYEFVLETSDSSPAIFGDESLDQAILNAIALDELQLYYQPIISTSDNQVEAFEALLRWFHPEKGVMYPAEFLSYAEEHDLMYLIDSWVIERACQQLKAWNEADLVPIMISINISPYRFCDEDFFIWFSKTVKNIDCDVHYLQLEINRANRIMDEEIAIQNLHKLKQMGVSLAIDNFAAANSNQVDSVTRLPLSTLKIDRRLTLRILENPDDTKLVGAIVRMAQDLDLHVVAEGIETQDQLNFLRQQKIDAAQGYFTGRPVPANEVPILISGEAINLGNSDEGASEQV